MKDLKLLLLPLVLCVLFVGCKAEPLEGDEEPPSIQIESPTLNQIFYTANGVTEPRSLDIRAVATDNNAVVFGIVTIEDDEGNLVDVNVSTTSSDDLKSMTLTSSLSTIEPGVYTLNFLFRDANGNDSSQSISVVCQDGGGTDETAALKLSFFASDKVANTLKRVQVFEDGTVEQEVIAQSVNDARSITPSVTPDRLLFGSTEDGLEVYVHSLNTETGNKNKTLVSSANFKFSTLGQDQVSGDIYYFLQTGNPIKIPVHQLYKMDEQGSSTSLVLQTEEANSSTAIKQIVVAQQDEKPLLIMHDGTRLFAYDPESGPDNEDLLRSQIYTDSSVDIYDIQVDQANKKIYMILNYNDYYNVAVTNFDGSDTNVSFVHIPHHSPSKDVILPHRIKLDLENEQVYWFTQSDDRELTFLRRIGFDQNDDDFETIWQTESCYCHGEVLDVSIEDYHIIESPTNQEL